MTTWGKDDTGIAFYIFFKLDLNILLKTSKTHVALVQVKVTLEGQTYANKLITEKNVVTS